MIEKPLERLNYYNGQRLEASDLKLEQEYHVRVRRWLNRSLYSPGIARGLEVREEKGTRTVVISPGLALDAEGHEIILLEEAREVVPGRGRQRPGRASEAEVEGLYLTIRYDEQTVAEERGVCWKRASGDDSVSSRPASGGPARIDARPVFNWRVFLPDESSGEIVLAQVELDKTCKEVYQINTGVRRYVGPASAAKVRQYALEGAREVARIPKASFPAPKPAQDVVVNARIYFHIRGRQPNAVVLYLRAETLSPLYYTELGTHSHGSDIASGKSTGPASGIDAHSHAGSSLGTDSKTHSHAITAFLSRYKDPPEPGFADIAAAILTGGLSLLDGLRKLVPYGPGPVRIGTGPVTATLPPFMLRMITTVETAGPAGVTTPVAESLSTQVGLSAEPYTHSHTINGQTGQQPIQPTPAVALHTHNFSASIADTGVRELKARSGDDALKFVDGLQIWIGKGDAATDHTDDILGQLADANSTDWPTGAKLGDGTGNHAFVVKGTGPIRLDFLPDVYFTEGEYFIELRVLPRTGDRANGGRVLYNLYVE